MFTADGANRFWTREEEVHVSADVAYGMFRYVEATGDTRVPAGRRRRDPVRDQPLLGRPRRARDGRRVRAAPGHGPGRVPLPHRQQRVHQPPRPVAPAAGRRPVRRAARPAPRGARRGRGEDRPRSPTSATGGRPSPTGSSGTRTVDGVIEQFTGYFERDDVPDRGVGREQHAALPEGLPPLQLRDHASCSSSPTS